MDNLEPGVKKFIDDMNKKNPPPLSSLSVKNARNSLNRIQLDSDYLIPTEVEDAIIDDVSVRIFKPINHIDEILPVIIYLHGGGWILGNKFTHDRLMRELANDNNVAVVFVNYSPAPEQHYPVQLEEIYKVVDYISKYGDEMGLNNHAIIIMGDSVGGNMATVITLLAKYRQGPHISYQILTYPVTIHNCNTESCKQFENGPWLTKASMEWFFDAYCPDKSIRDDPTISPLNATLDQLSGLPPALIITDENDILRDQGESYAHKLMQAGVDVTAFRCLGTIHDFLMLNPLANTNSTRGAINLINVTISKVLSTL